MSKRGKFLRPPMLGNLFERAKYRLLTQASKKNLTLSLPPIRESRAASRYDTRRQRQTLTPFCTYLSGRHLERFDNFCGRESRLPGREDVVLDALWGNQQWQSCRSQTVSPAAARETDRTIRGCRGGSPSGGVQRRRCYLYADVKPPGPPRALVSTSVPSVCTFDDVGREAPPKVVVSPLPAKVPSYIGLPANATPTRRWWWSTTTTSS